MNFQFLVGEEYTDRGLKVRYFGLEYNVFDQRSSWGRISMREV